MTTLLVDFIDEIDTYGTNRCLNEGYLRYDVNSGGELEIQRTVSESLNRWTNLCDSREDAMYMVITGVCIVMSFLEMISWQSVHKQAYSLQNNTELEGMTFPTARISVSLW
ncbi:hypothetical protein OPV22_010591 [Ensete ventricosum]|uniref:Uncharacterized protein n=1 Tax=Ensete ventricosum TaxID=4639 RepID=A0AAV8RJG0_ENSVE|nr:hypothetical protein OPV22_010591 [Ensete ventricosum]